MTTSSSLSLLDSRSTLSVQDIKESILRHVHYSLGKSVESASARDFFEAAALAVREPLIDRMLETEAKHQASASKRVYYISMEFLIGKSLESNLINLGVLKKYREALKSLGVDFDVVIDTEPDAGLGNGGLGRLAACFIDSMATLGIAGYGYGINYEYGLFKQEIKNGWQHERPDNWLALGSPWQFARKDEAVVVPVYGNVEYMTDLEGNAQPMWVNWQAIIGVPHDMPVVGYGAEHVNFLRLYSARGSLEFDMELFNEGDYMTAVEQKIHAETISKVLYPSDAVVEGRELRLLQEYFMVACSIRDMIRRHEDRHGSVASLSEYAAVQLNDTHPALAVAELLRLLIDEKDLGWEEAWSITQATCAYTNHTLLPEALETWPLPLLERVLPRHMQIIFEINRRLMEEVSMRWPGDVERMRDTSIIEEVDHGDKQVRMCNLAIVGCHSVNGVSALHSDLVTSRLVPNFYEMSPEKFNNKTNGITPRRWLLQANPELADLISNTIGTDWIRDLTELRALESYSEDTSFQATFRATKLACKRRLASIIAQSTGYTVNPGSMFDVQVKRIHQYKRQLLAALRIIHDYNRIQDGFTPDWPRTYVFAGKAAPGYWAAKQIVGLINHIGKVVNRDPRSKEWMQVVFIPNYRVSLAERLFPASELSEQISTAGFEASGTGNMKFMLNGALTMGTLDGANVEMKEEVGDENIYIFGMTAEQINEAAAQGKNLGREVYDRSPEVRRIFDQLQGNTFSPTQSGQFSWAYEMLVAERDPYFHLADFKSYVDAQFKASREYGQTQLWTRKAILNVARSGKFSSDRTVREYANDIWSTSKSC